MGPLRRASARAVPVNKCANGKTELLGGLVLLLLVGDDEEAAEIYGLALDKDQAALAYNAAARMVALSPVLGRRLTVTAGARRIIDERMASFFAVTAGDALGALGINACSRLYRRAAGPYNK